MEPDSDVRALLTELTRGNDAAFWSLWENYCTHLYGVCLRRLNGVHADAADAVSRSMLVARERLPSYARHIANLEAWLTRLTCNVCLDIHRERQRRERAAVDFDEAADEVREAVATRSLTPEDEMLQAEACSAITTAIGDLPTRLRSVAEMRFVEELDYGTIARRLVITQESARKRVQQAREMLSGRLGRELTIRAPRAATP